MKRTVILSLITVVFLICNCYPQEQFIGFKTGFIYPDFFRGENLAQNSHLFMGFNYEYVPKKAMFSISSEVQYIFDPKWFMLPVSLNFNPGQKIKILTAGGILPILRLKKEDPDRSIDIGSLFRIGIGFRVNKTISLYGNYGLFFIPYRTYHYSHFGPRAIHKKDRKS